MRVLIDASEYRMSKPVTGDRHRGVERGLWRIAQALVAAGHRVDVVCAEEDEFFIDGISWWPMHQHPKRCDVLIACEHLDRIREYTFDKCILNCSYIDPRLHGQEEKVDHFVCVSEEHMLILTRMNVSIPREKCVVIGPGVDIPEATTKDPHSALWANSPDRGLHHLTQWWGELTKRVPEASIGVSYGLDRYVESVKYIQDHQAVQALDMQAWARNEQSVELIDASEGITVFQQDAWVFPYPCEPLMPGSIVHSYSVLEAAAAGMYLILSDADGLPAVFGEVAEIIPAIEYDAWVEAVVKAMLMPVEERYEISGRNRAWAEQFPWFRHAKEWADLVEGKVLVGTH